MIWRLNSGVNSDRMHQMGTGFLVPYMNMIKGSIPSATLRKMMAMARVEGGAQARHWGPQQLLEKLQGKLPGASMGGSINIPKFHNGGVVDTQFAGGETMALLKDKEAVFTPEQLDMMSGRFVQAGGDKIYQIAPVIHAAEGMDVHAVADIATRKMLDALKVQQYNESRANGVGRRV